MVQEACVLGNTSGPPAWGPFWPISQTHKEFRRHLGHFAAPRLLSAQEPSLIGSLSIATQHSVSKVSGQKETLDNS
jgi:hypothetical protein